MKTRYLIPMILASLQPHFGFAASDFEFFKVRRANRQIQAHTVKSAVADFDASIPLLLQLKNEDEARYSDLRAVFGKALHHQNNGFITRSAYQSMVRALDSGSNSLFNAIQLGLGQVKLVNPQASLTYSLSGSDSWLNVIPPAPSFASAQTAGEMVELYCTVLARDVPFYDFDTSPIVEMAVDDLNKLTDFKGPKINGEVTPETFLRGNTPGDLVGPYISQFLYQPIPVGSTTLSSLQNLPAPDEDFLSDFATWLHVINGGAATQPAPVSQGYIRTPRDLSAYVHYDSPGQPAYNAALILLSYGTQALDRNNPYLNSPTQSGFVTFGVSQILHFVREAVQEGLKAAWYEKWQVNRRLRPEEFGFYVDKQKNGQPLGINPQLIDSDVLDRINTKFSTYFLPQAYAEGCPCHPSYPAGHATLMGAAVTVLKAFFNEEFEIPSPKEPNPMNADLQDYLGPPLTVGGELNKLAANIALGRDHAGVHYRSDGYWGMELGEAVAIQLLNNESFLINENFKGFNLTKFDGTKIVVGGKRAP